MPAEPTRLTDDLWLAAHDSVDGRPRIGDWPLGVGLATGLLAELLHGGFLDVRDGELFRAAAALPGDPALRQLLIKMEAEERSVPSPAPWARVQIGHVRPPSARDHWSWPPPVQEHRHSRRGHKLGTWMSYLAYEHRAENRVVERLARAGLARRVERRRLFRAPGVRYLPISSVASGSPANVISVAAQRDRRLPKSRLFLAGLFLATGLHHDALATLTSVERSRLEEWLGHGLDEMSIELLQAADTAVGEAAMR